jgi:hypothetical protein
LGIFNHTDSLRLIAFNSPGFDTDGTFLDKTAVDTLSQTAPSDSCGIASPRGGKRKAKKVGSSDVPPSSLPERTSFEYEIGDSSKTY